MTTVLNWVDTKDRFPDKEGTYLCIWRDQLRELEFTKEATDILHWSEEEKEEVGGGLGPAFYDYDCEYEPYVYDDIRYWTEMPIFHLDKTEAE